MCPSTRRLTLSIIAAAAGALFGAAVPAHAEILGEETGPFTLTAKADRISTPEGGSFLFWGFAADGGRPQYPGPTLIVDQGAAVSITVANPTGLGEGQRVSLSFPGQSGVTATCGGTCVQGAIGLEAVQGSTVTYTFTASRPGTFLYNSASRPDVQIEMGLFGALIVRPTGFVAGTNQRAYGSTETTYDQEYLFLLSEIDSTIHDMVEQQGVAALDQSGMLANPFPNYWFINGRNAPDTMAEPLIGRLPTQPYNSLPRTRPGERVLMRVIGGGRDMHPFHHHGNHARVIAVDGFLKQSVVGDSLNLSHEVFTIQSLPGQTVDAIFSWTGKDLGWDIYGDPTDPQYAHTCTPNPAGEAVAGPGFELTTGPTAKLEYCPDHGKKIPVTQPEQFSLAYGGFWAGAYLGTAQQLPPGEGGLNPNAGYTYMWHSHTEKEITNYDVFPGGMMTMLIVEPTYVSIP